MDTHSQSNTGTAPHRTALGYAAEQGDVDKVKFLLSDSSNDVNEPDDECNYPLHLAAENGHAEVVSLLLAEPLINVNVFDEYERTPLYLATSNGHADIVKQLVSNRGVASSES